MKGHMEDGKFHPHKPYQKKGIRKSRDQSAKTKGVKVQRKVRSEPDRGWKGLALNPTQLAKMYVNCKSNFAENGKAEHNAILNVYTGSATSHTHGRTSCPEYKGYCYYCGLNIDALEEKQFRKKRFTDDEFPYDITKAEPILETGLSDIFDPIMIKKRGIDTEEIDFQKLDHVAKSEIEYILERENKLGKGDKVEVTLVDVRPETSRKEFERTGSGDTGSYQYDYKIFKNGTVTPFAGTAYGSISMGHVMDMSLELYDVRQLV